MDMEQTFERYEAVAQFVFDEYSKINYAPLRRQALRHTDLVDGYITILAQRRNLDVELLKISALLHDIARFSLNTSLQHAQKGATLAYDILMKIDLFEISEIEQVCQAIRHHSDKNRIDVPFDEALKDADLLAQWSAYPCMEFSQRSLYRWNKLKTELSL